MLDAGVVTRESKVELLAGVITEKMGTGSIHDFVVRQLYRLLAARLPEDCEVGAQSPVRLRPDSRPEPDLWVSKAGTGPHRDETIGATDLALVIEVADSSLARDREVKLPIYSAAGVPEYWIVDVQAERVEVMTGPGLRDERDVYARVATYGIGDAFEHALVGRVEVARVFA